MKYVSRQVKKIFLEVIVNKILCALKIPNLKFEETGGDYFQLGQGFRPFLQIFQLAIFAKI